MVRDMHNLRGIINRFLGLAAATVLLGGADAVSAQEFYTGMTGEQCAARGGQIRTWTSTPTPSRPYGVGECYVPPRFGSSGGGVGSGGGGGHPSAMDRLGLALNIGQGLLDLLRQPNGQDPGAGPSNAPQLNQMADDAVTNALARFNGKDYGGAAEAMERAANDYARAGNISSAEKAARTANSLRQVASMFDEMARYARSVDEFNRRQQEREIKDRTISDENEASANANLSGSTGDISSMLRGAAGSQGPTPGHTPGTDPNCLPGVNCYSAVGGGPTPGYTPGTDPNCIGGVNCYNQTVGPVPRRTGGPSTGGSTAAAPPGTPDKEKTPKQLRDELREKLANEKRESQ